MCLCFSFECTRVRRVRRRVRRRRRRRRMGTANSKKGSGEATNWWNTWRRHCVFMKNLNPKQGVREKRQVSNLQPVEMRSWVYGCTVPSCSFTVLSATFTDTTCHTKHVSSLKQSHNAFLMREKVFFFTTHLLPGPHLDSVLLIKVIWAQEDVTAVHIQSLKKQQSLFTNRRVTCRWVHSSSVPHASHLAEFGLVKRRQIIFGHHDDSTLVAVLTQRFGTNQGSRAWKSRVDSQHLQ